MTDTINNTEHQTTHKFTAAQVAEACPPELQGWAKHIAAHFDKARKCDEKAQQHFTAIGQYLAKAKGVCDEGGFDAFREKYCPKLGKTRAYELLAIARDKKSIEEIRADTRVRVAKHRANKVNSVTETEKRSLMPQLEEAPVEAGEFEATSIVLGQKPEPANCPRVVKSADPSLEEFTAILCGLLRKIDKQKAERFSATAVEPDNLAKLIKFLTDVMKHREAGTSKPTSARRVQGNCPVSPEQSADDRKAKMADLEGTDELALARQVGLHEQLPERTNIPTGEGRSAP